MREIKFRAFDKTTNDMVKITSLDWDEDSAIGVHPDGMTTYGYKLSELDLLQFTGCKDKDGIEIYKSDFVEQGYFKGLVVFDRGQFFVQVESDHRRFPIHEYAKVIGNFHENKDLLKNWKHPNAGR